MGKRILFINIFGLLFGLILSFFVAFFLHEITLAGTLAFLGTIAIMFISLANLAIYFLDKKGVFEKDE